MASEASRYSTKELSKKTWPDFEKLFQKPGGLLGPGVAGCWCMYNHRPRPLPESKRPDPKARRARNRREKRDLVEKGRAHGVLVYSDGEPIGWCQYGPKEELPRVENRPGYRKLAPEDSRGVWRITCFVVDKRYRRSGVASTALKAALDAIKKKGRGRVEAYPITRWGDYSNWFGTESMLQKEGFETVAPFGKSNVLMQRTI